MSAPVTLFHVSDIHFGIEDQAAHDWFAEAVARERPDAVVCTGDLTQRARLAQFEAAGRWLTGFGVPVIVEPGNHDLPYYNLVERFRTPYGRYRQMAAGIGPSPQLDRVTFLSFTTTARAQWRWPWSDGVVRPLALEGVVGQLKAMDDDPRLKCVVCHHPLAGPRLGGRNPTIGGDEALRQLARHGADLVLSGHVHDAFDITHEIEGRPIRMIGAGTLSRRLRKSRPSYNVIRIGSGRDVEVESRLMEGRG